MKEVNLSPASITANLETRFVGQKIIYYPSLTSTMEVARQEAHNGAAEGTVIIAGEQTAGRGRVKRAWLSPVGNIALSLILYPELVYLPSLIMLASLAVVHSIEIVTGLKPQIKWPNDVLINDKKICGILIENEVQGSKVKCAVIGIGMNVNLSPRDFPEMMLTATSLSHELGRSVSRLDIIRQLLVEAERLYLALSEDESVYEEWKSMLVTLGKRISVKSGKTTYEGIAESVMRNGSLLLRHSEGTSTEIVAGDAVTLRG